jgi:hypothetical protein
VQNQRQARHCIKNTQQFQLAHPNIDCSIPVSQGRWCPGEGWRNQQYFQINNPIIQSIYDKYGWAGVQNWPTGQGPGPGGPGGFRR